VSGVGVATHELLQLAERWRPYRSLAVSYLFASEYDEPTKAEA
jgi:3-methyladenine DNA glycosylase/8-oxoguanine DNA glycosylase